MHTEAPEDLDCTFDDEMRCDKGCGCGVVCTASHRLSATYEIKALACRDVAAYKVEFICVS